MLKRLLGKTNIEVSRLCYGSLTLGPLQANLSPDRAGALIEYAYESGVNFVDTADLYDNYAHIRAALNRVGKHQLVVASKSYAYDEKTALETFNKALTSLGRDYIDIWLLHEQESVHTLRGHEEALKTFIKLKEQGYIRAVGLSTHYVQGVEAALTRPEIDVIHPIYNMSGVGIQGGGVDDMAKAIEKAHNQGIGVYGMKILGGGNLLKSKEAAFDFGLKANFLDAIALGMQDEDEIDYNVLRFNGLKIPSDLADRLKNKNKKIIIDPWCTRCKACIEGCQHGAMAYDPANDLMVVDKAKCVLCGYCSKKCPDFCIKII